MDNRPADRAQPTLHDYQAMMGNVRASDELRRSVKQAARARRVSLAARRRHRKPTLRFKRAALRSFAAAACLALVVAGAALAGNLLDWPALSLGAGAGGSSGNSFTLAAYADENPDGQAGKPVELNSDEFTGGGGFSGSWYNPADHTFWSTDWAGYKYRFALHCTGNNVSSITYEIQGDRSYFETIDNDLFVKEAKGGASAFTYSKTVSFDYDRQNSISDDRIVSLYIGFPLSEEGRQACQAGITGRHTKESDRILNTAIEKGAADEISKSRLKLTATFKDASRQSKSFVIRPVNDFDARYEKYFDDSYAYEHLSPLPPDASEEEKQARSDQEPSKPELYTITEVPNE